MAQMDSRNLIIWKGSNFGWSVCSRSVWCCELKRFVSKNLSHSKKLGTHWPTPKYMNNLCMLVVSNKTKLCHIKSGHFLRSCLFKRLLIIISKVSINQKSSKYKNMDYFKLFTFSNEAQGTSFDLLQPKNMFAMKLWQTLVTIFQFHNFLISEYDTWNR